MSYPLVDEDRQIVSAMREQVAPFKGKMGDPSARGPFDEVMEHTPDVPGVTYEQREIDGVTGIVCTPRSPRPGTAILYLHGGAYPTYTSAENRFPETKRQRRGLAMSER